MGQDEVEDKLSLGCALLIFQVITIVHKTVYKIIYMVFSKML